MRHARPQGPGWAVELHLHVPAGLEPVIGVGDGHPKFDHVRIPIELRIDGLDLDIQGSGIRLKTHSSVRAGLEYGEIPTADAGVHPERVVLRDRHQRVLCLDHFSGVGRALDDQAIDGRTKEHSRPLDSCFVLRILDLFLGEAEDQVAVHLWSSSCFAEVFAASTDTTGRALVLPATVPGLRPLRAA